LRFVSIEPDENGICCHMQSVKSLICSILAILNLEMTETKDPGDHKPDDPFSNFICAWNEYQILEVRFELSNRWER